MTVLNDRSQGGASIKDGSMELMVHHMVYIVSMIYMYMLGTQTIVIR